ncbi:hypothetical protein QBC40DRAFT_189261, partial [Triangularia verruculosa]
YKARFKGLDPRNIKIIKYFTELVVYLTKARLNKNLNGLTVKSIRWKMRIFITIKKSISYTIYNKVCNYIRDEFRYIIPLLVMEKVPIYLTIENYITRGAILMLFDHYNYIYEGSWVNQSALLKLHSYTSIRL